MPRFFSSSAFVALVLATLVLASCSSNKEKDEETKVAKLIDFEESIDVKRLWTRKTGEGKGRKYLRLVPAIANDMIYAADADGKVSAYKLEDGERVWRNKTDYPITGGVGATREYVMFGTVDGIVVTLDAKTGEKLWEASTSSEILAPPASNGSIVVAQTIDARVFAFNASTGEQVWAYDHLSPVLSLRGTAGPVLTTTQVICAFDNGQIVSFSATDGSRAWEQRISQPKGKTDLERIVDVDGTPVVSSGVIYAAGYQGNIAALGRAQGNPIWKKAVSSFQRLSVDSGKVFVSTDRSRVIAFNAANGDEIWKNEDLLNREITAPAALGDYVVVIDKDEHAHVLSQVDGKTAQRFKPKGDGFHAPMISRGGKLYILSDDGRLSAYETRPLDD